MASNNGQRASPSQETVQATNSWYSLVDDQKSAMDKFLDGDDICLLNFESDFFAPVRNKLRMSTAGILNLEAEQGVDTTLAEEQGHPEDGRCGEKANAVASMRELYDEMQGLVDDMELLRVDSCSSSSSRGSKEFCVKLEAALRRMRQTRDKVRSLLAVAEVLAMAV